MQELQGWFAACGIHFEAKIITADLGIERGLVQRACPKDSKRRKAAQAKLGGVLRISRLSRFARRVGQKILRQGVHAQRSYAANVFGVAPTVLLSWRRTFAKVLAPGMRGRCLDTLLQLEYGEAGDPFFTSAFQVLNSWIDVITHSEAMRDRAERA